MTRRGRRARADAGEGGHGREHVCDDVVVAILVANRQVGSVVGKQHHLLGLKPTMVARRPYTFFSYVSAELGAQGVIAEKRRA